MIPVRHRRTVRELFTFGIVGVAATVTHFAVGLVVYYLLPFGLSALWANFIAFSVAFLVSYFGNAILVFPETKRGLASFFRFLAVSLVSLALNQGIVHALVNIADVPYWQALIVVLMVVPPVTFLAMKYWGVRGMGTGRGAG
ncbi:MAG: GtrA family protein [Alphaproteobacteria bacterium]|nr:GtrA family protein [Alphaproteobacteria bacterium]